MTTAIGYLLAFLAGCGGEVNALPQRGTGDGGSTAPSAPWGGDASSEEVARGPDAQSDAALKPSVLDGAAALTGPAECTAAGGQCEVGAVCGLALGTPNEVCGPGGAVCCLQVLCGADATVRLIQASDYDQSCSVDSDCVPIHVGNACSCEISCGDTPAAINKAAMPLYTADAANSLHCECPPPNPLCANETFLMPRCVGGMCQITSCPTQ